MLLSLLIFTSITSISLGCIAAILYAQQKEERIASTANEEKIISLQTRNHELEISGASLSQRSIMIEKQNEVLLGQISDMQGKNYSLNNRNIELETGIRLLQEKHLDTERQFDQFKVSLKAMSAEIIQHNRAVTLEESKQSLSALIDPLKNDMKIFKDKIEAVHKDDSESRAVLKTSIDTQIRAIFEETKRIGMQANNLADALKGDTKSQGAWGEMILEEILKASGLEQGIHYTPQGSGFGMKDEEGQRQKPDIIINLPDDQEKHIIIDAKVSLTNYERFFEVHNPEELTLFMKSIELHISQLSGRKYEMNEKLFTPDYTLMFIPIEGAYSLAVQTNREIFKKAWEKGIILTCPSTLFGILRTIGSLWKLAKQNKNVAEIVRISGNIYGKIFGVVEDLQRIETQFNNVSKSFSDVRTKISGKGGVINMAESIKKLGAKSEKSIANLPLSLETDNGEGIEQEE